VHFNLNGELTLKVKMARMLIGSSNIRRFYKEEKSEPKYKLEFVTVYRAFEVALETVKDKDRVIISVIENFIEKAVANVEEDQKQKELEVVMNKFMTKIEEISTKLPETKLVLAYPILRPANEWMTRNEDEIRQEFERAFNTKGLLNISKVDAAARESQVFEKDGVHLNKEAGGNFVSNLIEMSEAAFEAEHVEMGEEGDSFMERVAAAAKDSEKEISNNSLKELRKETNESRIWRKNFEHMLNSRFMNDNVMFARLRDEVDSEANRKKEDRTLVMGLEEPADLPRFGQERNDRLKVIALNFCKAVKPSFVGQVLFAATCGKSQNGKMKMEFRLESVEQAREIRKIFATERSAKRISPDLANLQVITMVSLATRIRMDIMKAIARRIETNEESAYVPNFLSRPIMHIKKKPREGEAARPASFIKTLTFVEAVCLHGRALKKGDLDGAQDKAKGHFRGTMRQHFLLLEDLDEGARRNESMWASGASANGPTGSGEGRNPGDKPEGSKTSRGTKRPNDGPGGSGAEKMSRK